MPTPGEHKTVQARILEYAEAIGWTFVSQKEAERRRELNRKERREHKEDSISDSNQPSPAAAILALIPPV